MGGKRFKTIGKKRAVCAGLFLGIWLGLSGCVRPTVGPGSTNTPVPQTTEGVRPTPEQEQPTGTPELSPTEPAVKPTVAPTAGPTEAPGFTPTVFVTPTEIPDSTPSVKPEDTTTPVPQEGSVTGVPTLTPEGLPEPTLTPIPLPTVIPEYDTLLRNGWQRTEDFFGCREIFFSGKFDDAEPVIGEGSCEFGYRAVSDASVLLRIIGEENAGVQPFVEELRQNRPECLIEQEGPEDYSYAYVEGKTQVNGRVYACRNGGTEHRMRVEFYSPAGSDMQTEGYGFYLR